MKKFKKLLILLLVASLISTNFAFATSPNESNILHEKSVKSNLKILYDTDHLLIYTYVQNGMQYKNIEKINGNEVFCTVSRFDKTKNTYKVVDLINESLPMNVSLEKEALLRSSSYIDPATLSYRFYFSTSGNNMISGATLSIIRASLIALFPASLPRTIAQIANYYYSYGEGVLYYKSDVYIETGVDPNAPGAKWHKEIQRFYLDSYYSNFICEETKYYQWGW